MTATAAVDVTVTIVNHENREAVLACLRELMHDTSRRASIQVIVVDNVSQDGSVAAIHSAFPAVEVIERERRGGFGSGHNLALRHATGRHVLMLNDDTIVSPGAIDTLAGFLDDHPEAGLAAPQILNLAGATQASAWRAPSPLLDLLGATTLGRYPRPLSIGSAPCPVGWAMGCALLGRREALVAVGGFDERYFMYSEEIDLARRLAHAGRSTYWVPAATVVHEGQVSTGGHASATRAVEMARSRRLFWERHYSMTGRLAAQLSTSLMFLALAIAARARGATWRPFWLQARESWGDSTHPGLREQAAAFNARADRPKVMEWGP